jgi:hypothetical protein
MRLVLIAAILCALILAGCGGGSPPAAPTATPLPPTDVPTDVPPVEVGDNQLATMAATSGVTVPLPGTLTVPTQSPDATAAPPIVINSLSFTRSGGLAGAPPLTILLQGDGTLTRNDETVGQVSAEQMSNIAALLDQIRFYDLEGIFTAPGSSADIYKYTLTVSTPNGSRTLVSQDGMTPAELFEVYNAIIALGDAGEGS